MPVNLSQKMVKNHRMNLLKTLVLIPPHHHFELKSLNTSTYVTEGILKIIKDLPLSLRAIVEIYIKSKEYGLYIDGKKMLQVYLPVDSIPLVDSLYINDKIVSQVCEVLGVPDMDLYRSNLNPRNKDVK